MTVSEQEISNARKKLSTRIRELRKKKKWTQQRLADEADLTIRHIQRLESNSKPPAIEIDSIIRLSKAFKISPSQFLNIHF